MISHATEWHAGISSTAMQGVQLYNENSQNDYLRAVAQGKAKLQDIEEYIGGMVKGLLGMEEAGWNRPFYWVNMTARQVRVDVVQAQHRSLTLVMDDFGTGRVGSSTG